MVTACIRASILKVTLRRKSCIKPKGHSVTMTSHSTSSLLQNADSSFPFILYATESRNVSLTSDKAWQKDGILRLIEKRGGLTSRISLAEIQGKCTQLMKSTIKFAFVETLLLYSGISNRGFKQQRIHAHGQKCMEFNLIYTPVPSVNLNTKHHKKLKLVISFTKEFL